jgi:large conductance mechanosensitive channel
LTKIKKNMGFVKEFKDFAMRGNLIDFAVGVVVGGAFGKVTTAFVDGMVMPVVGKMIGGVDFSDLKLKIQDGSKEVMDASGNLVTKAVPEIFIGYGAFISTVIDFIVVAFVMFLVIKAMNKMKKTEEAAPPAPSAQEVLLGEIRDLLKK